MLQGLRKDLAGFSGSSIYIPQPASIECVALIDDYDKPVLEPLCGGLDIGSSHAQTLHGCRERDPTSGAKNYALKAFASISSQACSRKPTLFSLEELLGSWNACICIG